MISRRNMIKFLGATTAGLSLPRFLNAATLAPRRVVFIYTPEGLHFKATNWSANWINARSQTDFDMVGMGAPLNRHKADLVAFDNLAIISNNPTRDNVNGMRGGVETHTTSKVMLLTNRDSKTFTFGDQDASGESLDLYLGRIIGQQHTPLFPSLQLGVAVDNNISGTMTFLASGSPVFSQRDPLALYNSLFSSAALSTTATRRTRVLQQSSVDMNRFLSRLPAELKPRMDSMTEAIHTLEQRLIAKSNTCARPVQPQTLNVADGQYAIVQSQSMLNMITAAFSCDLTRVVSLVYQGVYGKVNGGRMGGNDDIYNSNLHTMSHVEDPTGFVNAKKAMFEQIATLADRLKRVPEGSGTMLDNTLLVLVTEETGGHQMSKMPFVTIGGKNMGVQVGNYLSQPTIAQSANQHASGFPHGNLWRSVIKAMGLSDQSFGNPTWSDQLVPGFLG